MKLQLAYDGIDLKDAIKCIDQVKEYIDIIEVGTPFVLSVGMEAVRKLKALFPEKEILADLKIMDGGMKEASMAYENGASYATVLGVTDRETVKSCVEATRKYKRELVVDMICVKDVKETVKAMEDLGVDIIGVHTGTDQQKLGRTPLDDLKEIKSYVKKSKVAVAGGINSQTISEYIQYNPDIIIVGKNITKSDNPKEEARKIRMAMKGDK